MRWRRRALAHPTRGRRELLFFLAAYCAYDAGRWLAKDDAVTAQAHAQWIAGIERSAGVGIERAVQHAVAVAVSFRNRWVKPLALLWVRSSLLP